MVRTKPRLHNRLHKTGIDTQYERGYIYSINYSNTCNRQNQKVPDNCRWVKYDESANKLYIAALWNVAELRLYYSHNIESTRPIRSIISVKRHDWAKFHKIHKRYICKNNSNHVYIFYTTPIATKML